MKLAFLIAIAISFAWSALVGCFFLGLVVAVRRIVAAATRIDNRDRFFVVAPRFNKLVIKPLD